MEHIILCGHTDCGCIRSLDQAADWIHEPHIARWIDYARPAKTQIEASGLPEEERHLATVRANVLLKPQSLGTYDPVRDGEEAGTLTLHGWIYHLATGIIESYQPEVASWAPLSAPIGPSQGSAPARTTHG